jgi:hypothetical protein
MAKIQPPQSAEIEVKNLDFDKKNPRFPKAVAEGPEDALIEKFARDERLQEIIDSIATRGYFPGEPLLVVSSGRRFTVIEGNRRLAALKLLNGLAKVPKNRSALAEAVDTASVVPTNVPCLVFSSEDEIVRYLGFRHITGIKAWGALQKARYIERLLDNNFPDEKDYDRKLKALAKETGSKPAYLGQTLAALALYNKASAKQFYQLEIDEASFDFSILSTALSYSSVVEWVGLQDRSDRTLKSVKDARLKRLMDWLFAGQDGKKSVVGESRNLKKLAAVLASESATKHLDVSRDLNESFELSKGPSIAISEALIQAERKLAIAWQWLPRTEVVSTTHLERVSGIINRANHIRAALENKLAEVPPPVQAVKKTVKAVRRTK